MLVPFEKSRIASRASCSMRSRRNLMKNETKAIQRLHNVFVQLGLVWSETIEDIRTKCFLNIRTVQPSRPEQVG
jgi:hypothetical protein